MADDQPMWGNNQAVAPTLAAAIIPVELGDNFKVKGHHLSMIKDRQFDGRTRATPHKHIAEFIKIYEFDIEIESKKGAENAAADHLSRLENPNLEELRDEDIDDNFPDKTLIYISSNDKEEIPWRCVHGSETQKILDECHHGPTGGHYGPSTTAKKVFDVGFYSPTFLKEAHTLVQNCDVFQHSGSLSRRDEMPQNSIQVSEIFDIWGTDFMGAFSKSHKFEYILVAIDYVSKWTKDESLPTNDA
ncbi:reverse transcriptase domain-containing protein [Tanacetum coccineum]